MDGEPNSVLAAFLIGSGKAIIEKLPIIFAVGIAYGLSNDKDGAASLSGLVGFLMITTLLSVGSVANLKGIAPEAVNAAFGKIDNAFIGIISGVVGALMYNKFSKTELPTALAFFSGKRLAPIMTAVVMMPISIALLYIWPIVYGGLVSFGTAISSMGPLGAGLFGFFNRLLIPTGLHHALNSVFWFDTIGINDIGNFWGGTGVKGITGMYQVWFLPCYDVWTLWSLVLLCINPQNLKIKRLWDHSCLQAGFSAFFTGVTEPIEFSFMFVAPALYLVHALLTGLSLFIVSSFGWTAGFGFSAGFVDLFLSSRLPLANKPYMIVVFGVVYFVIYYVLFRFLIVKFNIKTPGREEVLLDDTILTASDSKFAHQAEIILNALGGKENVKSVDYCTTRLRLELFETENIDEKAIKGTGAAGIVRPGGSSLQVIVGTNVQFVADEFKNLIK
ncbi:PTS transporter subunit EIIC [Erysipelothrix sp. Poltava]|nr:PTS transporter subunit EIIC [Erysipelothrix sp. Poltava]